GAGASGIIAARQLKAAGIDVTILEARDDAIGGRLHKVCIAEFPPGSGRFVEVGGNWIEGLGNEAEVNPVYSLAWKHDLHFQPTDFHDVTYRSNKGAVDQAGFKKRFDEFNKMAESLEEMAEKREQLNLVDISLRAAYRMAGWYPQDEMDDSIEWNSFDYEQAESPDVSSFWKTSDIKTFKHYGDGSDFVMDQRGYQHILEAEAKSFGCGYGSECLQLGKVVTEIQWNFVQVHCKDGSVYKADYVVSSVSLGVLQNKDLKFTPPLPDWKIQAIHSFHMATYTKIFVAFPSKFWTDQTQWVWYGSERRGEYANWQVLDAKPFKKHFGGKHVLLCTVTGEIAHRVERQSDEKTLRELMVVLRNMYGPSVPDASAILVSRWHSDPLFRGSYTNWPIGMLIEEFDNLIAPVKRLWFTGEHTSMEYFGYVHGAILAGNRTGNDLVACI
ncbi:amine oxidase, partial [Rhizoclosmatium globosum]